MQLHKAFSSITAFPNVKQKKKLLNTFRNEKDFFLTMNTSDDYNFAMDINNKIEKQVNVRKMLNLRILKRKNNNDVYSLNWISNKNILRNHKKNLKIDTNDMNLNTFDKKNYKNFFRNQSKAIINSYFTARNYKYVNELKTKYYQLNMNTERLITNSKQLCFDNYISTLLQRERNKIKKNEIEYNKSLDKEKYDLKKDIKKFEIFQVNQNFKFQKAESEVQKFMKENNIIFETVKMNIHEYHLNLNKVKKIIKDIVKLEENVIYVYHILGLYDEMINLKQLNNFKINKNAKTQAEIDKNINNIYMQSNILFNDVFKELSEELSVDYDKIYHAINNKEKMILQKISEKDDTERSIKEMEDEFKQDMKNYQLKYNNYMSEYLTYLKNYEEKLEKYNLIEKNSHFSKQFLDNINYICEIKDFLFNQKNKKQKFFYDSLIYGNIIIPCLEELKKKEYFVENIIKKLEHYEKKEPMLFNKSLTDCKYINKMKKFQEEKKIIEDKAIEEKLKIIAKHEKIIIKNKYKYNLRNHNKIKGSLSDLTIKRK